MARAGGCRSLRQTCLRSVVLIWRAILQKWDGPSPSVLKLLRSTGYVTQHADSKDRRRRLVGLTDEGHAFLAHVTASQTTWLAHAIEYALDDGERGDLAAATTLIERIAATESLPTGGDTR